MAILAGFLDLTRLLVRVMGSDLVLNVCNTCAGFYKVLWVTSEYNITPKMLNKSIKVTVLAGLLDLTQLLVRVMGSDLVLSVCNTCAGLYKVLWVTSGYNITPKCSKCP